MVKKNINMQPTEKKQKTTKRKTLKVEKEVVLPIESPTQNESVASADTAALQVKVVETFKHAHKRVNIPNILTILRIWAIPVVVATFFFDKSSTAAWIGVLIFALASITDYLDGYLARHLNQLSRFGRVLDPIADKLLICSILLMLAYTNRLDNYSIIPAIIILSREILVSGLREFLAEIKVGCPVTRLAKWKTACQMCALPMLIVCEPFASGRFSDMFYYAGQFSLWGAAILTVITGYDYWKSGRKYMDDE